MLLVKTKVGKSTIDGVAKGLFADEFIPRGMLVWRFEPGKDLRIPKCIIHKMTPKAQAYIRKYGYSRKDSDTVTIPAGNGKFINHSYNPNLHGDSDDLSFAIRDIQPGEELFEDYTSYDDGEFCSSFLR